MEHIVFSPPDWVPVVVFNKADANRLVADRGYRFELPDQVAAKTVQSPAPPMTKANDDAVNLNEAELSELTNQLGLTIARARRVMKARPLGTIEDVIAVDNTTDWIGLFERGEVSL